MIGMAVQLPLITGRNFKDFLPENVFLTHIVLVR